MSDRKSRKHRRVHWVQMHIFNPLTQWQFRHGIGHTQRALLETTGRVSGQPRVTPVGNGLIGDTFWIVTEHGHRTQYVRNLQANPRVRVNVRGRWRAGTAQLMPDDDPIARQRTLPQANARAVRMLGTELLTVRIDLDPEPASPS